MVHVPLSKKKWAKLYATWFIIETSGKNWFYSNTRVGHGLMQHIGIHSLGLIILNGKNEKKNTGYRHLETS